MLIPDFRLDTDPLIDRRDLSQNDFISLYKERADIFFNGAFTVGVTNVSYYFPDNVTRVPVGYKAKQIGIGPRFVRQANGVDMTLTDVINIIKHGGHVKIHRLIIPVQKKLDGTVNQLAPIGKMQHWALMKRNEAKEQRSKFRPSTTEYRKYDSLQLFYKLLGNGGYGKSAQGLGVGGTTDFLTGKPMYIPFSRTTNPYVAAQYTSIARYQVNSLMDLMEKFYPTSLIPSVTTDGFIFCTNTKINVGKMRQACEDNFDKRWVVVNTRYFVDPQTHKAAYFELKSHIQQEYTKEPLYNIRTRMNMTPDNHIKALVGLRPEDWPVSKVIQMIHGDKVTFKVNDLRLQSMVDMKHTEDDKRFTSMRTWNQPKYLNLSPDDTYEPIGFVPQGDFGYYLTRPFATVDDVNLYKADLKPYRSIFPAFRKEYGEAFMSVDQKIRTFNYHGKTTRRVTWVYEDVPLIGKDYPDLMNNYRENYVPKVLLRYLAHHQMDYNLKAVYQNLFCQHYKRFASFQQALKRSKGLFVNPMCVIKEKFKQKLAPYHRTED